MVVAISPRARQAHALADADVIIFVAEIRVGVLSARREAKDARDLGGARQCRQCPDIREVSGREQDGVTLAVGACDLALQFAIEREIAAKQPRVAVADAMRADAAPRGRLQARACRDTEIVVGAERDLQSLFRMKSRVGKAIDHHRLVRRAPSEPIR
jgi:hypothetical protein